MFHYRQPTGNFSIWVMVMNKCMKKTIMSGNNEGSDCDKRLRCARKILQHYPRNIHNIYVRGCKFFHGMAFPFLPFFKILGIKSNHLIIFILARITQICIFHFSKQMFLQPKIFRASQLNLRLNSITLKDTCTHT